VIGPFPYRKSHPVYDVLMNDSSDAVVVLSQYSDDNLKATFAWLQAQEPVQHMADNTAPPTPANAAIHDSLLLTL
jgi:hypothetical protein